MRGLTLDALTPGVSVPRAFRDAEEEHLATRRAAGLFDFSFIAHFEIRGPGAAAYLDAIQSRNVRRLPVGRIAYTLLLAADGAVFIDATLWRLGEDLWWLFTGRRGDRRWLAERASGLDVALRDRSGEHAVIALQGPQSGRVLARTIGAGATAELAYFRFAEASLGGIRACVGRLGYSGELGYEILVPAAQGAQAWVRLLDDGASIGIRECGFAAANSLRIESGFVLFGSEITGRESAAELGLQRLVEGTHRRPESATRWLAGLIPGVRPTLARTGATVPAARLTSECDSPLLRRRIALGYVPAAVLPGATVRLADGRLAGVARLPFYDPGRRLPRATPL